MNKNLSSDISIAEPQIVITDGYTLNPGDLSWEPFFKLGKIRYHDRTPLAEITARCKGASVIITNKTPINEETIRAAENLRLIAVTATGYNIIDTEAATKNGVVVCNVPVYGTDSVAQHCFALILELSNRVGLHEQSVRAGDWSRSDDWCYTLSPIMELAGKTLGLIGFGRIGRQTARIAAAFGMKLIYYNRSPRDGDGEQVGLEELFAQSDFISVHCPLTKDNEGFINERLLSLMKPTAFLVNTSRGQLINEQDLAKALRNKTIAGAALDVLSMEPPPPDHPLIGIPQCIITPHIAWVSYEARRRMMQSTLENVIAFMQGAPINVVNGS